MALLLRPPFSMCILELVREIQGGADIDFFMRMLSPSPVLKSL